MADSANEDSVGAAARPPQYRKAVQTLRGDIKKKKDRISGINGEISESWGKIEGFGVNKIGARLFEKLDKLEADERSDAVRTLQGMIAVSEWPELTDLVDDAEGNAASYNLAPGEDGDGDEDGGDNDDDQDPPAAAPKSGMEALKVSKARLRSVPAVRVPDAMDPGAVH